MFSVGVSYTLRQIVAPLRHLRLVVMALVANFLLVPAWAVLITWLLRLDEPYEMGILLVSAAAGAPFLVKLVALSDGDVAFAGSLLVLLLPVTVIYMPLVVPLLVSSDAEADALAIASPLLLTNLLPLAVGVLVFTVLPAVANRVRPFLGPVSMVALIALVVLTVAANVGELVDVLGQRAIIAALLLIVGSFVIGFALGVPDHHRDEIGLATAQRNIAAATIVATQTVGDPATVVTVVVTSLVAMAVLFPLTTQLKKRFGSTAVRERANRLHRGRDLGPHKRCSHRKEPHEQGPGTNSAADPGPSRPDPARVRGNRRGPAVRTDHAVATAEGRAQCVAGPPRRCRLRCLEHVRWALPDADVRPAGGQGPAVHALPHDGDVFADAPCTAHGSQPPFGRHGSCLGHGQRCAGLHLPSGPTPRRRLPRCSG